MTRINTPSHLEAPGSHRDTLLHSMDLNLIQVIGKDEQMIYLKKN